MLHAPLLSKLVVRTGKREKRGGKAKCDDWTDLDYPEANMEPASEEDTHRVSSWQAKAGCQGQQTKHGAKTSGAMGTDPTGQVTFQSFASRGSLTLCSVDAPICILLRYRMPSRKPQLLSSWIQIPTGL